MAVKVGLVSLGCPKNLVDSEEMLGLLKKDGFEITTSEHEADVLIVNTCSFIDEAKEESIKTILEIAQNKEKGNCRAVLVAGCLAQRYPEELLSEMPEVDGLIGTGFVTDITGAVERVLKRERVVLVGEPGCLSDMYLPRMQSTPFYTAYLKIAEGCGNNCSYCVIPQIRGPFKSREMDDILAEAEVLAGRGVKEIILVAQDTTRYGTDLYSRAALSELLEELDKVKGFHWIRVLYTYPDLITDDLIQSLANSKKLCRYLDIPLQHASNTVLKRMKRRGSREEAGRIIEKLRTLIPGITLRTSFITGFPGETEEEFQELLDFIEEMKFDRAGVFSYSREEGTAAAKMKGQVPQKLKLWRRDRVMALQQKISLGINCKKVGKAITVLVEGKDKAECFTGRSEGDAPGIDGKVFFKSDRDLKPGDFVRVLIRSYSEYDLDGEEID